ncbi:unnamed protein product [Zymoseptoria tritici ST99CH_3D7]|uniref:Uncharacterized protein n=1 Tax=Zymoseptoria tritici (strain ST99CH_3D7) TaxID=1276538 RepID=A0A1X7RLK6_ZYMT9|nr:unnamed protein product [Zymoseptoria tritici ST99CH_3D7]
MLLVRSCAVLLIPASNSSHSLVVLILFVAMVEVLRIGCKFHFCDAAERRRCWGGRCLGFRSKRKKRTLLL